MAKRRYKRCRICGRHEDEAGPISARGLCRDDRIARMEANADQVAAGKGPFAEHRARRQLMKAQKELLAADESAA